MSKSSGTLPNRPCKICGAPIGFLQGKSGSRWWPVEASRTAFIEDVYGEAIFVTARGRVVRGTAQPPAGKSAKKLRQGWQVHNCADTQGFDHERGA